MEQLGNSTRAIGGTGNQMRATQINLVDTLGTAGSSTAVPYGPHQVPRRCRSVGPPSRLSPPVPPPTDVEVVARQIRVRISGMDATAVVQKLEEAEMNNVSMSQRLQEEEQQVQQGCAHLQVEETAFQQKVGQVRDEYFEARDSLERALVCGTQQVDAAEFQVQHEARQVVHAVGM